MYFILAYIIQKSMTGMLDQSHYHQDSILKNELALEVLIDVVGSRDTLVAALACIEGDYVKSLKILLSHTSLDPSAYDNQLIRAAAQYGRPHIISVLLADYRVDPSAKRNASITSAVKGIYLDQVRYNRNNDRGVPPTKKDYLEVARLLLSDPRVDPSIYHNCLVRSAYEEGNMEMVELLLTDPRVNLH